MPGTTSPGRNALLDQLTGLPAQVQQIAMQLQRLWSTLQSTSEDWQKPLLENSWANFGGGDPVAGYLKDAMGFVHLKGHIKSGASGKTCFTLPEGFRPAGGPNFAISGNASGTPITCFCYVHEDGTVQPTMAAAVSFVSLQTVTFLAEA